MGWVVTPFLAKEILLSSDAWESLQSWKEKIESFSQGKFDSTDELHQNLEYKKFREISQNENLKKHIWRHFWIWDFLAIFRHKGETRSLRFFWENGDFELRCLLYEAGLLREMILSINENAKIEWRKVLVIPNLSYGYLPVSAIADELSDPNIDIFYWVKVWSSSAHHDRGVMDSSLFSRVRQRIIEEQPIIIIVDGTTNIRKGNVNNIKYPDAYEWFLNQMIALNFLAWYDKADEVDYSAYGKNGEDIQRLFDSPEFQRTVTIYKQSSQAMIQPYRLSFYNTWELNLTIRDSELDSWRRLPRKFNEKEVKWPSMVFCNVGVLHEQLPEELKNWSHKHSPAYFDDSWAIIALEYSYNEYWLQVSNPIEKRISELKSSWRGYVHPKILNTILWK